MSIKQRQGISLIVLVITIIVILILAGAVILSLSKNNPITQANKAVFLSDLRNFQHELSMYETGEFTNKMGAYDPKLLQADETSATYDGNVIAGATMNDFIPSLARTTKYAGQFKVVDGELVYQGSGTNEQSWAAETGINVVVVGEPTVTILPPASTVAAPGTDIVFTVKFSSNAPLTTVDLTGKVEVLDNNNVALPTQPVITVGTISGTNADSTRQVDVTVKTNTLVNGSYNLKIKSGTVINANGKTNTTDKISPVGFDIDATAPTNPTMSANPSTWTNGDVTVTITYSSESTVKEYSLDSTTWQAYTSPVVVTTNGTTVYARGKDAAGNISGVATLTVGNIDKIAPIVSYGLNGASAIQTASTTVTVTDVSGSGINAATLQYVWDTQNTTEPSSGWTLFTNGQALLKAGVTGTYYLWIKATDNAGNSVVSKTNAFVADNTAPTIAYGTNGGGDVVQVSTTITASDVGTGINTSSLQYIWDTQSTTEPVSGWTIFTNGQTVTKTGEGRYYLWVKAVDNAGNLVVSKTNAFTIGEVAVSPVRTENTTFAGATTGFSYNNPVIPAGLVAVNTTNSNWYNLSTDYNKGLVAQDADGNQFVWVPVDGTNVTYSKWGTAGYYSYTSTTEDTQPAGFSDTNISTTYKGFYIARYESMFDYNGGNIRAASKKSINTTTADWSTTRNTTYTGYLWNQIKYPDAKNYSESMAASYGYDLTKFGTNLITGTEWDTVMKWVQNAGKNVTTDSRAWGNYSNSLSPADVSGYGNLQISGYSNYWIANNIYDLAGNMQEWTSEKYGSNEFSHRSGSYKDMTFYGSSLPASSRVSDTAAGYNYNIGFRIALYIK